MPAGWYRVRLTMSCDFRARLEIFADTGQGLDTAECIERMNFRGAVRRDFFVNIPRQVFGFRFDPVDTPGQFRLDEFRIEPVSRLVVLATALGSALRQAALRQAGLNRGTLSAIGRGLRCVVRGRVDELKRLLLENLSGPSMLAPPHHDPVQAYAAWRKRRRLTGADRARMYETMAALPTRPLFSMLLLAGTAAEADVRATIESLLKQVYPDWELCVGVNSIQAADRFRAQFGDQRIRFVTSPEEELNLLLQPARGDFVGLLDPGDRLALHALFAVAQRVSEVPAADFIYSDEDFAAPDGTLPFFKPDWSPEYVLSFPYTGRLALYRTMMVRTLGGFRTEFGSAQEYDLVLRFSAAKCQVNHVADVLYHTSPKRQRGRATPHAGAITAVREHLHSVGRAAAIEPGPEPGLHRVRFAIGQPRVSILLPTAYRRSAVAGETFLARCLESIRRKSTYSNYHIMVLDNGAISPEIETLLNDEHVSRVPYAQPFNWAAAMNQGAALARGEHLLILDDDTEVITPDWIECLLEYSQQAEIGAVGARLHFADGTLQHAGVTILDGIPGHPFYRRGGEDAGYFSSSVVPRNWSAVTGACLMTRAETFRELGGFDESFGVNFNDIDYCLRVLRSGRRIVCTPYARLYHHETATKTDFLPAEREMFRRRWGAMWPQDPYSNPNLSTRFHDFRIEG